MLFAPVFASVCAFASVASAAPVSVEERGLLSGLLSNTKVTQLQSIVGGLTTQTTPVLSSIQGLVSSSDGIDAILAGLPGINVTADAGVNLDLASVSLGGLEGLVTGLSGKLLTGQLSDIESTLTDLGSVSPELYSLIEQILTAIGFLSTAQAQIQQLLSSGGVSGILAKLTNTASLVSQLSSLVSTIFVTLNTVTTQISTALSNSSADVTSLNAALQALQAPIDTSTAQILIGANTIVSGLSTLVRSALLVTSALKNLTTLNGVASSVQSLVTSLGLSSIQSALSL